MYINLSFVFREPLPTDGSVNVRIDVQHADLVSANPSSFNITTDQREWIIYVEGLSAGHSILSANVTPSDITE